MLLRFHFLGILKDKELITVVDASITVGCPVTLVITNLYMFKMVVLPGFREGWTMMFRHVQQDGMWVWILDLSVL